MQSENQSLKKLHSIARFLQLSGKYYFQNFNLTLFYDFIQNDNEIGAIIQKLLLKYPELEKEAIEVVGNQASNVRSFRGSRKIDSFEEWVAFCLFFIQAATKSGGNQILEKWVEKRTTGGEISREQEIVKQVFNDCVEPILIYIELQIQQTQNTLHILQRHKILCEWHYREKLYKNKELVITQKHLNKYLFDQGFTYSLTETTVPSGKIDNFAFSVGLKDKHQFANLPDAIVIESKIYDGDKSDIQEVRNQVNKRMEDLGFAEGFCVIFNKTGNRIDLSVSDSSNVVGKYTHGFYHIKEANKTTFFLIVNLHESFTKSRITNKEVQVELD